MRRFTSRKLLITLLAIIAPLILEVTNLHSFGVFLAPGLAIVVVTYLLSQGHVDGKEAGEVLQDNLEKLVDAWEVVKKPLEVQSDWRKKHDQVRQEADDWQFMFERDEKEIAVLKGGPRGSEDNPWPDEPKMGEHPGLTLTMSKEDGPPDPGREIKP